MPRKRSRQRVRRRSDHHDALVLGWACAVSGIGRIGGAAACEQFGREATEQLSDGSGESAPAFQLDIERMNALEAALVDAEGLTMK